MTVAQMLAHCNVSYEMVYTEKHPKPKGLMKLMLKLFVKQTVVSEKPYKKNSRTAPAFLITDEKDFEKEKKRLTDYLIKTQELGEAYFHNKESHSFGPLTKTEWNNLFYKHLNHHLEQFGV
jgi:PHD/YefM family antitoxin component YafN of YafNO toxin-antitoxin module